MPERSRPMMTTEDGYMRLEYFSQYAAADSRRKEFDIRNHSLLRMRRKPDFLFIGDSITHYWELGAFFHRPEQLIVNRGIGGDTTAYLRKRFYVDALQLQPVNCILGIGINDSIDLEGDYWKQLKPLPYDTVCSEACENVADIIRQAKESKSRLILTSLLPIRIPILQREPIRKQYIRDMNGWLEETARRDGLIFVDYYSAMTDWQTDTVKDGLTYDGLHPNGRGYEVMAEVLQKKLLEYDILL